MKPTTKVKFTDAELTQLHRAIYATWQTIGDDTENCNAQCGGKPMKLPAIIECTLDADYLEMYGANNFRTHDQPAPIKALIKQFRELTYDAQKKIARTALRGTV